MTKNSKPELIWIGKEIPTIILVEQLLLELREHGWYTDVEAS